MSAFPFSFELIQRTLQNVNKKARPQADLLRLFCCFIQWTTRERHERTEKKPCAQSLEAYKTQTSQVYKQGQVLYLPSKVIILTQARHQAHREINGPC